MCGCKVCGYKVCGCHVCVTYTETRQVEDSAVFAGVK